MTHSQLSTIYFSATATTEKCVKAVAQAIGIPTSTSINLADRNAPALPHFGAGDVVVAGMPVYGGRIPAPAAEKLKSVAGGGAKAIAIVVYGNRDYDDALLELTDLLTERGFTVVAAAAFIGQHSIFPKVGTSRPDDDDMALLGEFGRKCAAALTADTAAAPAPLAIKGHRPYKHYGGVPLHPAGDEGKCSKCSRCVELCPAAAIDAATPWATDPGKCIACGRCIAVCSHSARKYKGLKYANVAMLFKKSFGKRKAPEMYV